MKMFTPIFGHNYIGHDCVAYDLLTFVIKKIQTIHLT